MPDCKKMFSFGSFPRWFVRKHVREAHQPIAYDDAVDGQGSALLPASLWRAVTLDAEKVQEPPRHRVKRPKIKRPPRERHKPDRVDEPPKRPFHRPPPPFREPAKQPPRRKGEPSEVVLKQPRPSWPNTPKLGHLHYTHC